MKRIKTIIVLLLIMFLTAPAFAQSIVVDNGGRLESYNTPAENKENQETTSCPAIALLVGAVAIFFLVGGYYEFKKKGYSLKKFK